MDSESFNITQQVIEQCCENSTPALLMLPEPRLLIDSTFVEVTGTRITFDVAAEMPDRIPPAGVGCVYFRFDNATFILLCRVITVLADAESQQVLLDVLSDCVTHDRSAFRVRVRSQKDLRVELRHGKSDLVAVKLEDISRTGALVKVGKDDRKSWSAGDFVRVSIQLEEDTCELHARINRPGWKTGLEFIDPETHSTPDSVELRSIVAGLERRYLRNRIRM